MRHDCDNYIDKIRNQSENVYRIYKIFTANMYLVKKLVCSMHNHKHISIKDSRIEYWNLSILIDYFDTFVIFTEYMYICI